MRNIKINKNAITPVIAVAIVLMIVVSVSAAIMAFGGPLIESTRSQAQGAMLESQMSVVDEGIYNIVLNEPDTKSVSNINLDEDSTVTIEEETSQTILWYSLDENYEFDVSGLNDDNLKEFNLNMIDSPYGTDGFRVEGMVLDDSRGPCFLAGTKVALSNGLFKNIEDIVVGDNVLCYNVENNEYSSQRVTNIIHNTEEVMTDYCLLINDDLRVTPNHLMYSNNVWRCAGDLKTGDFLFDGNDNIVISSIIRVYEKQPSFDISVDVLHNYFVKINDDIVLVHNEDKPGEEPLPSPPVALFTFSTVEGTIVLLDASASYDPDGSIAGYRWDINNDGTWDYPSKGGYNPGSTQTHNFGDYNTHTVKLEVIDNTGTPASTTNDVQATPPGDDDDDSNCITINAPSASYVYDPIPWENGIRHYIRWAYTGETNPYTTEVNNIYLLNATTGSVFKKIYPMGFTSLSKLYVGDCQWSWVITGDQSEYPLDTYKIKIEAGAGNVYYDTSESFQIIAGTPALYYKPTSINIDIEKGNHAYKTINIVNVGSGRMYYTATISPSVSWLTLYSGSASDFVDGYFAPSGKQLTYDFNGYEYGNYNTSIKIETAYGASVTIPVTMRVKTVPKVAITPASYNSYLYPGEEDSTVFFVYNSGVDSVDYEIEEAGVSYPYNPTDYDWLSVSPLRGYSFGERDPITVTINNTISKSPGKYPINGPARIKVSDTADDPLDPVYFLITLYILAYECTFLQDSSMWDPEVWWVGSQHDITWDTNIGDGHDVKIDLMKGDFIFNGDQGRVLNIGSCPATKGDDTDDPYSWQIPYDLLEGNDYWIKISYIGSESDKYFGRSNHFAIKNIDGVRIELNKYETVSYNSGVVTFSNIDLEGAFLVELWDDNNHDLKRPFGRIFGLDSDSLRCDMPNQLGGTEFIVENGGSIKTSDGNQVVKFSPISDINDKSLGLRLTQMVREDLSYDSMSGGEYTIKITTNHYSSYTRDTVPKAYDIKINFSGEYGDAWETHLNDLYPQFEKQTGGYVLFKPSAETDGAGVKYGVSFSLIHSIVKFGLTL